MTHISIFNIQVISRILPSYYKVNIATTSKVFNVMPFDFSYTLSEDNKYFDLFIKGDERGLKYIEHRFHKSTYKYARKIIENDFDINSILQDSLLKAWNYRNNINNMAHLLNHIKYWIRWECYRTAKINKKQRLISFDYYEDRFTNECDYYDETEMQCNIAEILENALAYLPEDGEAIIRLLKKGLGPQQIAKTLNKSLRYVSDEKKKCIDILKRTTDRLISASEAQSQRPLLFVINYRKHLDDLQVKVFKLYYEERCSFQQISKQLNISQFQLLKQYQFIQQIIHKYSYYGKHRSRNIIQKNHNN